MGHWTPTGFEPKDYDDDDDDYYYGYNITFAFAYNMMTM